MTAGFHHHTAKVYQFPVGERRRNFKQRADNMQSTVIELPVSVPYPVIDTCWYHQEAVASEQTPSN